MSNQPATQNANNNNGEQAVFGTYARLMMLMNVERYNQDTSIKAAILESRLTRSQNALNESEKLLKQLKHTQAIIRDNLTSIVSVRPRTNTTPLPPNLPIWEKRHSTFDGEMGPLETKHQEQVTLFQNLMKKHKEHDKSPKSYAELITHFTGLENNLIKLRKHLRTLLSQVTQLNNEVASHTGSSAPALTQASTLTGPNQG
ncbi:MAG: hypothetical protein A3E85_01200 [Gammaproteobacteria bacterium RIFCSPHIGHO2_12_FULL_45_12]|nr:MAG: hypothetical protein A3E85_01200 [Gammaproteobacteria bacterium RIFCSPHIGHO2_12_FULL_45_12]